MTLEETIFVSKNRKKEITWFAKNCTIPYDEVRELLVSIGRTDLSFSKAWTEQEDEMLRKYYGILKTDILSYLMDRTPASIKTRANNKGIKYNFIPNKDSYKELINLLKIK